MIRIGFSRHGSRAAIALGFSAIAATLAIGAVGVDLAIKFQTALDQVQNTTNATAGTIDKISKSATNLSNNTTSSATAIVGGLRRSGIGGVQVG